MLEESTGNFSASRNVYDWYQTNTHVILNVMIKNLKETDVKVRLIDETLDVVCNLADGTEFKLHFNLFKPIYVAESSWTVTPSKLEIKLKKTDRKRWQSLEVIPEKGTKRSTSYVGLTSNQPNSCNASRDKEREKERDRDREREKEKEKEKEKEREKEKEKEGPTQAKSKYDWYQSNSHLMVSVLIRNLNEEQTRVEFTESTLSVDCKLPDGSDFKLHLNLFRSIVPAQSSYKVSVSKLELKIKKAEATRWSNLEAIPQLIKNSTLSPEETPKKFRGPTTVVEVAEEEAEVSQDPEAEDEPVPEAEAEPEMEAEACLEPAEVVEGCSASSSKGSSRNRQQQNKNWDKIVKEFEEDEKLQNAEGGVDELFREIYEKSGEEVRRAMNKSFTESGGTVLSTNWDQVGKDKVQVKPPDGCEFKKWD